MSSEVACECGHRFVPKVEYQHRLLCGDSTVLEDVERVMGGENADCVFTSPPYAVGVDYGPSYQDTIENLRVMLPILAQAWTLIVRAGGYAVVNFGDVVAGREIVGTESVCEYPMALEYWPVFRAAGWALWSRRIWCKPVARVHSPWAIGSNRAASDFEHVWTWKASSGSLREQTSGQYASQRGWLDTSNMEGVEVGKRTHGAGMAASAACWLIEIHSLVGGVVHEPFAGTGTTIIAAEQLHRRCYAIEIAPEYVAVTLQRFLDATGIEPELV